MTERIASQGLSPTVAGWPPDPYRGLNYFSAADAPLFGQRELEIHEAITLLSSFDTRVVLLHGGSGTGKSSFLRAGLCARLKRMPVENGRKFFFLEERRLDASVNDPLLIRATDDPIARLFEALRKAGELESSTLPKDIRETLRQLLAEPLPRNRLEAISIILEAVKALTAPPQRNTLVLLIDQAEEVLTLPTTAGADNVRQAFFELIEQTCFRSLDLRLIVSLRTEYYGRFCSFFLIRPTTRLTPPTEFGAGLMDYLLRPLGATDIAAAIRQPTTAVREPTTDELRDGLQAPISVYGFSYKGELPEMIAADLLRHAGEASTLPAMQIVCKQLYERVVVRRKRAEITEEDYELFGRAEGAIDTFMERALRDAATSANLPKLSDADVDSWAIVLSQVVGRAEGGAVQTLIASEEDLLKEAADRGIAEEVARAMLRQMVDPGRRLLRLAGGEGGTSAYSLGHDSLGPSVLRRSAQAAVRAEAEKQRAAARAAAEAQLAQERETADRRIREERYKARLALSTAAAVLLGVILAGFTYYSLWVRPIQNRVDDLTTYAARDVTSDFRSRLLLLAAALRIANLPSPNSWFINVERAKQAIREELLRSPIFGGTFDAAAWNSDGRRVIYFTNDKLIVHDLSSNKDSEPAKVPPDLANGPKIPPSIGLVGTGENERLVAFRTSSAKLFTGKPGSTLVDAGFAPPAPKPGVFIPRADILGQRARILFMHFDKNAVVQMDVLQVSGLHDGAKQEAPVTLDWDLRQAVRQPVLAEDCDTYAFLSRDDDGDGYKLWLGQIGSQKTALEGFNRKTTTGARALALGAITFARNCGSIVALTRDDESTSLHVVPLNQNQAQSAREKQSFSLRSSADEANISIPSVPQSQPALAAVPLADDKGWRVGWPTAGGLSIVDVLPGETAPKELVTGKPMLTGVQSAYVFGSLSFSPDRKYALFSQQQTFSGSIELRAFDLDLDARWKTLQELTTLDALVREACRIAKFQDGSNSLRVWERPLYTEGASQPCDGI